MTLKLTTAGESHGPCLTGILDGMPADLPLTADDLARDLWRRQQGYGQTEAGPVIACACELRCCRHSSTRAGADEER